MIDETRSQDHHQLRLIGSINNSKVHAFRKSNPISLHFSSTRDSSNGGGTSHSRGCIRNEHLPLSTLIASCSSDSSPRGEIFFSPFSIFQLPARSITLQMGVTNRGEIFTRFSTHRYETRDSRWNKSFCVNGIDLSSSREHLSRLCSPIRFHRSLHNSSNALHQGF